jgi:hypothetical protein
LDTEFVYGRAFFTLGPELRPSMVAFDGGLPHDTHDSAIGAPIIKTIIFIFIIAYLGKMRTRQG